METMCQCRFISCNKCATSVPDAAGRPLCMGLGTGWGKVFKRECMETLDFLAQFCCKPKIAVKKVY